jgi:hypothetical protein
VEASPEAFYGATVAAALSWLSKQVRSWARPTWTQGPSAPKTRTSWYLLRIVRS